MTQERSVMNEFFQLRLVVHIDVPPLQMRDKGCGVPFDFEKSEVLDLFRHINTIQHSLADCALLQIEVCLWLSIKQMCYLPPHLLIDHIRYLC